MDEMIRKAALDYHRLPKPGKIAIAPTKGLVNQRDLSLAYTPGVAAACEEIVRDPSEARNLTSPPHPILLGPAGPPQTLRPGAGVRRFVT